MLLFCSHRSVGLSDHVSTCGGNGPAVKVPVDSAAMKEWIAKLEKYAPFLLDKLKSVKIRTPKDLKRLAEEGDPVAAYMIGCSFPLRWALTGKQNKKGGGLQLNP